MNTIEKERKFTCIPSLKCANKAKSTVDDNLFNTLICIHKKKNCMKHAMSFSPSPKSQQENSINFTLNILDIKTFYKR